MKLGIVGSGKIVHDFLTAADKVKGLKVKGISSTPRSKEVLEDLQKKYDIPEIYTDNDLLFSNASIDTIYVAVPNVLHYQICKEALEAGKNVICEKPFVYTVKEAEELKAIADHNHLFIIEAITNIYLENFNKIKEAIPKLGPLHIVNLNYTQYSTRYSELKKGNLLPVFNPQKGGGALMDLGIYDIHLAVGLFGMPEAVQYLPNYQKGTDTSGVIILRYPTFICVMIAAKDSFADAKSFIEGEDGSLVINGLVNQLPSFELQMRTADKGGDVQNYNKYDHRMISEFTTFVKLFDGKDQAAVDSAFTHSVQVLKVLDLAKQDLNYANS